MAAITISEPRMGTMTSFSPCVDRADDVEPALRLRKADQQQHHTCANHQRANPQNFLMTMNGRGKPAGAAIGHDHVVLCDLKSRNLPAYLQLGTGTAKRFKS